MTLSDRNKRILLAIVFLVAAAGIAALIYIVFFRSPSVTPPGGNQNQNNTGTTNGGLPLVNEPIGNINVARNVNEGPGSIPPIDDVANGGPTQTEILTPNIVTKDPEVSKDGTVRFYRPDDGRFYSVDADGTIVPIGKAQFRSVDKVTWAENSNDVILEFPDGSNIYYNLDSGRQVTLPKEYEEFDFAPTGNQIAFKYMHTDPERRVLAVSNADGSSARTIESLGENEERVHVEWSPTGKVVATFAEFVDFSRQEVGFLGLNNENFKGTLVEGSGLQSQYSPDGMRMLYSVYSGGTNYNPSVWVVDSNGEDIGKNRKELSLPTFSNKCTFQSGGGSVFCGVPSDPPNGYGLEPGILSGVPDDIYRVDPVSGLKQKIAVPVDASGKPIYSVDANSMVVSADGKYLYFKDTSTAQIVKIDLK